MTRAILLFLIPTRPLRGEFVTTWFAIKGLRWPALFSLNAQPSALTCILPLRLFCLRRVMAQILRGPLGRRANEDLLAVLLVCRGMRIGLPPRPDPGHDHSLRWVQMAPGLWPNGVPATGGGLTDGRRFRR